MARHVENGFNYFPLDTKIVADSKIKYISRRYGFVSVSCYILMLCLIYTEGYALEVTDERVDDIAAELGIEDTEVRKFFDIFAERNLIDKRIYEEYNILTSRGIQKRYQEMCRKRGSGRNIEVVEKLWIIDKSKTADYIVFERDADLRAGNEDNRSEKEVSGTEKPQSKENKTKRNKNKVYKMERRVKNDTVACAPDTAASPQTPSPEEKIYNSYGRYGNVKLSDSEYNELKRKFYDADSKIDHLSDYMKSSGKTYADHFATIIMWADKDAAEQAAKRESEQQSSFDAEEFFNLALQRSFRKSSETPPEEAPPTT